MKKKYSPLPTMNTIEGMYLMAHLIDAGTFDVNPKYPKYWEVCKWAVD